MVLHGTEVSNNVEHEKPSDVLNGVKGLIDTKESKTSNTSDSSVLVIRNFQLQRLPTNIWMNPIQTERENSNVFIVTLYLRSSILTEIIG